MKVQAAPQGVEAQFSEMEAKVVEWLLRRFAKNGKSDDASSPMPSHVLVRPIRQDDFNAWQALWDGYNAFYGRKGETALAPEITNITWQRFFDPGEPVFALVAESGGKLVGLTHYLFHRSTTRIERTCYLQDLFTAEDVRGRGIGRSLIEGVYQAAAAQGSKRVYWQTHVTNAEGRRLYDKVAQHAGFIVYGRDA